MPVVGLAVLALIGVGLMSVLGIGLWGGSQVLTEEGLEAEAVGELEGAVDGDLEEPVVEGAEVEGSEVDGAAQADEAADTEGVDAAAVDAAAVDAAAVDAAEVDAGAADVASVDAPEEVAPEASTGTAPAAEDVVQTPPATGTGSTGDGVASEATPPPAQTTSSPRGSESIVARITPETSGSQEATGTAEASEGAADPQAEPDSTADDGSADAEPPETEAVVPAPPPSNNFRLEFVAGDASILELDVRCHQGAGNGPKSVVIPDAGPGPCKVTGRTAETRLVAMVTAKEARTFTCFEGGQRTCK